MTESGLNLTRVALLSNDNGDEAGSPPDLDFEESAAEKHKMYGATNLDWLYRNVYRYYADHGYKFIMTQTLMSVLVSCFSTALFVVLTLCIKWSKIMNCEIDTPSNTTTPHIQCGDIFGFSDTMKSGHPSHTEIFIICCAVIAGLYTLSEFFTTYHTFKYANNTRTLYNTVLGISDEQLQDLSLHDVFKKLMQACDEGKLPAIMVKPTPQQMVARIMRFENIFIALVNAQAPLLPTDMSANLQNAIYSSVVQGLLNPQGVVNTAFLESSRVLQHRIYKKIVWNVLILPFTLCLGIAQAIFFNIHELYTDKAFSNPRRWSTYAHWKLRGLNELPHYFQRRLELTSQMADKLIRLYPNYVVSQCNQALSKIAGAIVSVLFLFTLLNSSLMVAVKIFNISLLWYLTLLATVVVISRTYIVPRQNKIQDKVKVKAAVVKHSHLQDASATEIRKQLERLYRPKLSNILSELWGQLKTPYQLWCIRCEPILEFLNSNMENHPKVGSIYKFSLPRAEQDGVNVEDLARSEELGLSVNKLKQSQIEFDQLMSESNLDLLASLADMNGSIV